MVSLDRAPVRSPPPHPESPCSARPPTRPSPSYRSCSPRRSTTFDTKLDLLVDPGRFLSQSLSLWSPQLGMGEVQNQAYGYLLPARPVLLAQPCARRSAWLTERVWSTALTIIAFEGARRLALAWGGVGWRGALLVGAAYVSAPRFLTTIGALTGEVLPTVVLPWVVLPLVLARRGTVGVAERGSAVGRRAAVRRWAERRRDRPRSCRCRRRTRPRRGTGELPRRCIAVWAAGVVAACAWWLGPLLLLGRYSPPFLDYIESAANTTAELGWVNSVRGADHWVAYVTVGGRPWWPAGFALSTGSWLVVVTALVAGLSLAGLVGRRMSLTGSAYVATCVRAGLSGRSARRVGGWSVRGAAEVAARRPLAPLRNVHKVDPLVRLPLALGFGFLAHDARVSLAGQLAPGAGLGGPVRRRRIGDRRRVRARRARGDPRSRRRQVSCANRLAGLPMPGAVAPRRARPSTPCQPAAVSWWCRRAASVNRCGGRPSTSPCRP